MPKKLLIPVFIILLALITGILVTSNTGSSLRQGLTFLFILICPGIALTGLFRMSDPLSEFVLSVALSLALSVLIAEFMVLTHIWSPYAEIFVLYVISLTGAGLQIKNALLSSTRESE